MIPLKHWAFLISVALLTVPLSARADICAYENSEGQKLYSDKPPGYGWKKRQCFRGGAPTNGPRDTTANSRPRVNGSGTRTAFRSSLPRVTSGEQRQRDAQRRRILEEELSSEKRLLDQARQAQVMGIAPASVEELKNAQLYAKRVSTLNETISLHERNVEALKKELSNIR